MMANINVTPQEQQTLKFFHEDLTHFCVYVGMKNKLSGFQKTVKQLKQKMLTTTENEVFRCVDVEHIKVCNINVMLYHTLVLHFIVPSSTK